MSAYEITFKVRVDDEEIIDVIFESLGDCARLRGTKISMTEKSFLVFIKGKLPGCTCNVRIIIVAAGIGIYDDSIRIEAYKKTSLDFVDDAVTCLFGIKYY